MSIRRDVVDRGRRYLRRVRVGGFPARVRVRATMLGYRHVRHYVNSLQIKIAYAEVRSESAILASLDTSDTLKYQVT